MGWSKITEKGSKPFGWWVLKIFTEFGWWIKLSIHEKVGQKIYTYFFWKMINNYNRTLYGKKLNKMQQETKEDKKYRVFWAFCAVLVLIILALLSQDANAQDEISMITKTGANVMDAAKKTGNANIELIVSMSIGFVVALMVVGFYFFKIYRQQQADFNEEKKNSEKNILAELSRSVENSVKVSSALQGMQSTQQQMVDVLAQMERNQSEFYKEMKEAHQQHEKNMSERLTRQANLLINHKQKTD